MLSYVKLVLRRHALDNTGKNTLIRIFFFLQFIQETARVAFRITCVHDEREVEMFNERKIP